MTSNRRREKISISADLFFLMKMHHERPAPWDGLVSQSGIRECTKIRKKSHYISNPELRDCVLGAGIFKKKKNTKKHLTILGHIIKKRAII